MPHVPMLPSLPLKTSNRLDDVMVIKGDIPMPSKANVSVKRAHPPRLSYVGVPLVERPLRLWCKDSDQPLSYI
jgi:hypothetical protein